MHFRAVFIPLDHQVCPVARGSNDLIDVKNYSEGKWCNEIVEYLGVVRWKQSYQVDPLFSEKFITL